MSNAKATATVGSSGLGFFSLLTIVLVVLKAMGYINWSWWLVFAPVLVGFALGALILGVVLLIFILAAIKS